MSLKYLVNSPKMWIKNFPWKKNSGNKYTRGRVVIHGGEKEFTGATILAAEASLRTGVGSVKIICKRETLQIYSVKFPSALKIQINDLKKLKKFLKNEKITSVLIGPGAGSNIKIKKITKEILKQIKYVVIDADALTCFKEFGCGLSPSRREWCLTRPEITMYASCLVTCARGVELEHGRALRIR